MKDLQQLALLTVHSQLQELSSRIDKAKQHQGNSPNSYASDDEELRDFYERYPSYRPGIQDDNPSNIAVRKLRAKLRRQILKITSLPDDVNNVQWYDSEVVEALADAYRISHPEFAIRSDGTSPKTPLEKSADALRENVNQIANAIDRGFAVGRAARPDSTNDLIKLERDLDKWETMTNDEKAAFTQIVKRLLRTPLNVKSSKRLGEIQRNWIYAQREDALVRLEELADRARQLANLTHLEQRALLKAAKSLKKGCGDLLTSEDVNQIKQLIAGVRSGIGAPRWQFWV